MNKLTIICAVLVFVPLAVCTQAIAQAPSDLIAIADDVDKALNAHDLDLWLSYLTDDAVFDYVPLPTPLTGKEEIRAFFEEVFEGFPDFSTTEGRVLAASNIVVVEHNMIGTLLGEWQGIPPTGNTGQTPHIDIYDFEGDKIKRMTTYVDVAGLMVQLGVMPAPEPLELVPSFTLPDAEPTGLTPLEAFQELLARWNAQDLPGFAKMVHPDAEIFDTGLGVPVNRDAYVAAQEMNFQGFSDMRGEIVRVIDMGDGWISREVVFTGTHDGPFMGIPATGRTFTMRGAGLLRFDADGLVTNFSLYYDMLGMMQKLTAPEWPLAGTWIGWVPAMEPTTEPAIVQETFTPLDPAGDRLAYRQQFINADPTFLSIFPEADNQSHLIGEAVKTGLNTYEFTIIGYGFKNQPADRGQLIYIWVTNGTIIVTDRNTRQDTDLYISLYGPDKDVNPADGLPDEGAEPDLCLGPMGGVFKRVPLMPPCVPPPPPEASRWLRWLNRIFGDTGHMAPWSSMVPTGTSCE